MALVEYVRGNIFKVTANFFDVDGLPTIPASASVYLNHVTASGRATEVVAMSLEVTDGAFIAHWDSSAALAGIVYYSVRSLGPDSAQDGSFELTANPANPGS